MSNIDKRAFAMTKELATLMVERFSMNPVSCKLLNEAWKKEFPDEVAIAERMLALLDELEAKDKRIAEQCAIIASARKFISDYAGLGDVGAAEFIKIIDRAASGKGEAS